MLDAGIRNRVRHQCLEIKESMKLAWNDDDVKNKKCDLISALTSSRSILKTVNKKVLRQVS